MSRNYNIWLCEFQLLLWRPWREKPRSLWHVRSTQTESTPGFSQTRGTSKSQLFSYDIPCMMDSGSYLYFGGYVMEEKQTVLTADCPCTRNCPRHGNCAACVANHRFTTPGVPGCFFTPEGEKMHDRSFAALFRDRGLKWFSKPRPNMFDSRCLNKYTQNPWKAFAFHSWYC